MSFDTTNDRRIQQGAGMKPSSPLAIFQDLGKQIEDLTKQRDELEATVKADPRLKQLAQHLRTIASEDDQRYVDEFFEKRALELLRKMRDFGFKVE